MNNNLGLITRVMALLLFAGVIGGVYLHKAHKPANTVIAPVQSTERVVKAIRLLAQGDFEFVGSDGFRVHGYLRGEVSPEAKPEIVRLLNSAQKSRIIIAGTRNGPAGEQSVVEVFLTLKQSGESCLREVNLWEWLQQNKWSYLPQAKNPKKN